MSEFKVGEWARCDEEDDTFRIVEVEDNGNLRAHHTMQLLVYKHEFFRKATEKEIQGAKDRDAIYIELGEYREMCGKINGGISAKSKILEDGTMYIYDMTEKEKETLIKLFNEPLEIEK